MLRSGDSMAVEWSRSPARAGWGLLLGGSLVLPGEPRLVPGLVLCVVAVPSPTGFVLQLLSTETFLSRLLASVDFHCTVASRVFLLS